MQPPAYMHSRVSRDHGGTMACECGGRMAPRQRGEREGHIHYINPIISPLSKEKRKLKTRKDWQEAL